MNIRILLPLTFSLAFCSSAVAKDAPARLLGKKGSNQDVLIIQYKNNAVLHRASEKDQNKDSTSMSTLEGIYFYEPASYTKAMNLYKERKFSEAKKAFAKCEADFKSVDTVKGNYSTLSGFYRLECSRRMFDLKTLGAEQSRFRQQPLDHKMHTVQLELNILWEAVRLKDWARLDKLAVKWARDEISNSQLAQVAYCHALALEQLGLDEPAQMKEAIVKYNQAMVADHTLSIELVTSAAEKLLNIYSNDPKVKTARDLWGTEDEEVNSDGYASLISANTLVATYQVAGFENFKPLSAKHVEFLKFKAKEGAEEVEPAAKEEKAADKPEKSKKPKKSKKSSK